MSVHARLVTQLQLARDTEEQSAAGCSQPELPGVSHSVGFMIMRYLPCRQLPGHV